MSAFLSRGIVLVKFKRTTFIFQWQGVSGDGATFVLLNDTTKRRLGAITQWELKEEVTAVVAENALIACFSTAPSIPKKVRDLLTAEITKLFEERQTAGDSRWATRATWPKVKNRVSHGHEHVHR